MKKLYTHTNDWQTTVIDDLDQIESIRQTWQTMQNYSAYPLPNADIDRYISIIEPNKDSMQPYILLLHYGSRFPDILVYLLGSRET